jgi:hypothetical protein
VFDFRDESGGGGASPDLLASLSGPKWEPVPVWTRTQLEGHWDDVCERVREALGWPRPPRGLTNRMGAPIADGRLVLPSDVLVALPPLDTAD